MRTSSTWRHKLWYVMNPSHLEQERAISGEIPLVPTLSSAADQRGKDVETTLFESNVRMNEG